MKYFIIKTITMTTAIAHKRKGKQVDTHHVDQLISKYKKERWVYNNERIGKTDSLSTWYGLDELSAFLQMARENNASGIKMYYGVYPPGMMESPELEGRQTVVLVATKEKVMGSGTVNKDIYVTRDGKTEILAFNAGQICPPWCGSDLPQGPDEEGYIRIDTAKIGLTLLETDNGLTIL